MKGKPKNIPSPYKFSGTKIFRDTTALPFVDGGPLRDRNITSGKLLPSTYASALGNMFREGGPFAENRGTFDYATSIYASQPGNYYANGGQIQSQSCSPGYYWNGKECVKSFIPTAKTKTQTVAKNKKEQELIDYGKKTLSNKKVTNKPVDNIPYYGDISNAAQPDDLIENITEFADPTGYFSWDDAYRAKAEWDKAGSEYPTTNQALDMFGAVPALGKFGKLKYLKNADVIKNSMKYVTPAFRVIPWQKILNTGDTGQDINQDNINYRTGGMIKRADGSYSQRGLWDNIRANAGSGKAPTKQMLAQEKKINREYRTGGQFPRPYSLPEDSFKQGGTNLHNSVYASSSAQYPAIYRNGGMTSHFYASNVPDNNISNKDLTYPENSYVYNLGGNINNIAMNKYPGASKFLKKGSNISPLTNTMGLPTNQMAMTFREGGGIHINPANKGKFTASAKAAGMGVQEFASHVLANKENYSGTQVKRANFAHNAAGWKHANGGHMMAAGGWPPGLKLKNPTLMAMPYYTNAMTGLMDPSAEIGLQGQLGKKKAWTVEPHIGVGYNPNGKFPLSGGLDVRYKGLRSPNGKGFATVDMGAGYTPEQGAGAGFSGGYNFRLLDIIRSKLD